MNKKPEEIKRRSPELWEQQDPGSEPGSTTEETKAKKELLEAELVRADYFRYQYHINKF